MILSLCSTGSVDAHSVPTIRQFGAEECVSPVLLY
jgi:hypothetical protein